MPVILAPAALAGAQRAAAAQAGVVVTAGGVSNGACGAPNRPTLPG